MKESSALSGIVFLTGSNLLVKIIGVVSQLILASLISKDDFAVYALSASIAALVLGLKNGGSDNILVQRGGKYSSLSPRIFTYSLIFNSVAFLTLTILSIIASVYYDENALFIILFLNGISLLIGTLPPILGAKLSYDCRFKDVAAINLKSLTLKHLSTILFAFLGLRFFAFVLPLILQYLYASYLSYGAHSILPKIKNISRRYFLTIFNKTKWIMAGNLCFEISNNSQLFIIGNFGDKEILGVFFFCLILINSPVALINGTINSVIFPKLSTITKEKTKFETAALDATRIGFSLNIIAAISASVIFPLLINILWPIKWSGAIPLIKILIFLIPSLTIIELMNYILASKGFWKEKFLMLAVFVVIEIVCITLTAIYLPIIYTCIVLVILKALFSISAIWYTFKCCKLSFSEYNNFFIKYFLPAASIMALIIYLEEFSNLYLTGYIHIFIIFATLMYYIFLSRTIFINFYYAFGKKFIKY